MSLSQVQEKVSTLRLGTRVWRDKSKAGRLGNDRPFVCARLGVGYQSLGVCGVRLRLSGLGSRPAGLC
jgi:hypothetical protein